MEFYKAKQVVEGWGLDYIYCLRFLFFSPPKADGLRTSSSSSFAPHWLTFDVLLQSVGNAHDATDACADGGRQERRRPP